MSDVFGTTLGRFIGGCILVYFAGLVAAAGGVGGGGLYVPILLLVFGYELETAVLLSVCIVVGSASAQFFINVTKRHPFYNHRPLIYWQLVLTMLPAQLGGSNIGRIFAQMVPDTFIYILALLVLLFASYVTVNKGLHKWHEESEKLQKAREQKEQLRLSGQGRSSHNRRSGSGNLHHGNHLDNPMALPMTNAKDIEHHHHHNHGHNHGHDGHIHHDDKDCEDNEELDPASQYLLSEAHYALEIEENLERSSGFLQSKAVIDEESGRSVSVGSFSRSRQLSEQLVTVLQEQLRVYSIDSRKLQVPWLVINTIAVMWFVYTVIIVVRIFVVKCSNSYDVLQAVVYLPLIFAHVQAFRLNTRNGIENDGDLTGLLNACLSKCRLGSNGIETTTSPLIAGDAMRSDTDQHNKNEGIKILAEVPVPPGDVDFDQHLIPLISMAYGVGIVCTMLGIGGGEIFSPIILSYHVIPQVTSATTATMSVLNSLAQVIRDGVQGSFDPNVGGILLIVGFLGGVTGRQLGLWISARYGRSSVIIFFLAGGLFISCIYYMYTLGTQPFNSDLRGFC